ncbi:MAG: hypothetical protein NTZ78_04025 [Candidatus Aureabacteria bacterium]|nr:hypothetical protein [Candidatus Auribacterota bacterium]
MKKLITVALSLMLMVGLSCVVIAGSLDSPGAPSEGSGMYTLQNLYDYLTSDTALTVQSSFQEPTSGPSSTMKTTKEIGDVIKALHDLCNVTADNVELGKTFFCTQSGRWGVQTGTLSALPRPTATPTITPTPTPTTVPWDKARCEAGPYFGYWSPRSDGGDGCWLEGSPASSCTTVCAEHALTCVNANWSVGTVACLTCQYLHNKTSCTLETGRPNNPCWNGSGCYGNSNAVQDCDATIFQNHYRQCVCEPQS